MKEKKARNNSENENCSKKYENKQKITTMLFDEVVFLTSYMCVVLVKKCLETLHK